MYLNLKISFEARPEQLTLTEIQSQIQELLKKLDILNSMPRKMRDQYLEKKTLIEQPAYDTFSSIELQKRIKMLKAALDEYENNLRFIWEQQDYILNKLKNLQENYKILNLDSQNRKNKRARYKK